MSDHQSNLLSVGQYSSQDALNNSNERREGTITYSSSGPNVKITSSKYVADQHFSNNGESRNNASQRIVNFQSSNRGDLDWQQDQKLIISGQTDFSNLKHTKDIILELIRELDGKSKVVFEGQYKDNFNQRLMLLEHELEGTMRRVLNVSHADPTGSKRSLDYTKLLNEKQNALIDKDRKILNYEERLKTAQEKIVALELDIRNKQNIIGQKNSEIQQLRRLYEIKSNAIDKIKGQPAFSNSQEIRQIFKMVKMEQEGQSINNSIKNYTTQLQRDLNRLKSKEYSFQEMQLAIQSWILGLPNQSFLRTKLQSGQLRLKEDERYRAMQDKFNIAADIYRHQIEQLQRDNPNIRINFTTDILQVLKTSSSRVGMINGIVEVQKQVKITQQVPVQDARTKYLINALAIHIKKLHEKYPKLKAQMDVKLQEYMSMQMTEIIENDSLDRIIDIVRYVPQMVKVENVYTYSSQQNRKVEFHLRVLIKALLEEMEKVKREKGIMFEIDEGVIGMIRSQIMDVVDVDDILKVYRPVPKIVEVPKIIEKVVDNIVRIPQKYTTNQLKTEFISLQKPQFATDQKALIVQSQQPVPFYRQKPVQLMSHTQKVVSHPEVNERIAVEVRQKTNLKPEQVIKEKIVERQKPVIVEKDKIVIQRQLQPIQIIKEVIRYIQTEKQVIKQVQVIVEKIVQKIVQKQKIVVVPQIVEKIVEVIRYEQIPQIVPHVETRIEIVKQIVEKIVPVIHTQQVFVIQPQIVQKIVTVEKIIELPPKEIQVIRQVLRVVKQYEIIEVQVPKIIYETQIQIREVEKYIEVPIIVPQTKIQTEIHQVPFIQTIQMEKHIPVQVIKHVALVQERPVEVIRNVPYIMKEEVPVLVKEQKVVTQELYYERIKEVPTMREKIIEKIVEVPKCVEIEKIVEKIVIVPRIIEKIVEVPQIIQKIVEKIIQIPIQMPPVIHYIPQYLKQQIPREIQVEKIVYLTVDRAVQLPGDQILVKDLETRTNVEIHEVIKERVVIEKQQVPVTMHVDKIVTVPVQKREVQFVDRVIFKPIQVPVPVNIERTVPVYINTESVKVQPVTQIVQKIVEKTVEKNIPQIIPQIEERVKVQNKIEFKQIPRNYIQKQIQEVERFEEKIVQINTTIDQIKEVPYYIEKLIPVLQQIPKIYEYEKEPKVIFTPPTIEIVDRIVPKIINVNQYIERIVEKLVQVPHFLREVQVIKEMHEKNIPGPQKTSTNLKTVNLQIEKELIREKEKIIETKVNFIEQTLRTVTQIMERDRDPVIITRDRIIQIPQVMEKIVEKIVIMPQVVQILKYVHQLIEDDGININVDVSVEAQQYKKIGEDLQRGFAEFLAQLNKIKSLQPSAASRITLIEQYLAKFRRFIKYPKIHEIIKEKVVQKQKVVKVPVQKGPAELKEELAKVMLIEKLVAQISRIKRSHPQINLNLDEDINFIFRLNFDGKVKDVNSRLSSQLKQFQNSLEKKFSKMGGWSRDHQAMLKSFLQERFVLANIVKSANQQIKVSKKQNESIVAENSRLNVMIQMMVEALLENKNMMNSVVGALGKEKDASLALGYSMLCKRFDEVIEKYKRYQQDDFEPTRYLGTRFIRDLIDTTLRDREKQIELLKQKLRSTRLRDSDHEQCNAIIQSLQADCNKINQQLANSRVGGSKIRSLEMEIDRLNKQLKDGALNKSTDVRSLQSQISRLKLTIQQGNSHNECTNLQRGLESENKSLKREIEILIQKLRNAEKQLASLKMERDVQSPKRTIGTSGSISPREQGRRSIVISHVQRASQGEEYGENYQEYINGDVNNGGLLGYGYNDHGSYSGIQQRNLANSSATYRSGQGITSSQHVVSHPEQVESTKYVKYKGEGTQFSTSTAGGSGVRKYNNFYQRRYEENS